MTIELIIEFLILLGLFSLIYYFYYKSVKYPTYYLILSNSKNIKLGRFRGSLEIQSNNYIFFFSKRILPSPRSFDVIKDHWIVDSNINGSKLYLFNPFKKEFNPILEKN